MTYLVRARKLIVALAALLAVAQLGCGGGGGSSKDAGRDGKLDTRVDAPDVEAKPVCSDGGARAVSGEACACNTDCQSNFCVDGVCCDTACTDTCKRCDVAGSMGTCSLVPAGLAPRAASTCAKSDVGSCGTDGTCDGAGACRKYVQGTVCKPGTCSGAAVTNIQTCDGAGTCAPGADKVCVPFSCDATKQDCFGACASNSDCAPGVQCVNGTCGLKMNGSSCGKNEECASSFCTDGACCSVACQGPCVSCNQTGRLGACFPIAAGVPDPRKVCVDSGAAKCGQTGACDGFGACAKYAPETVCVLPSCAGTRLNTPGTCDGQGTCKPPGLMDCPPYACSAGACNTTCATNADCAPGVACVNKSCGPLTPGGACKQASDCASNFCVDGVCCNEACTGACKSCALASARGTCTPIAPGTVDNRQICKDLGAASCGTNGRCDGAGGCSKYATGTVCGGEKCASDVYTGPPTCNSTGQCLAPASRACLPFACNGTKCFSACNTTANCVSPNVCNGNSCGKKLPGAPCSTAVECASNVCAQGFCCAGTCNAACQSCGLPGSEGVCTNVATGALDPKVMCLDQGAASCGTNGRCAAGACQQYAAGTKCKDPTCPTATTMFTGQSTCDGAGLCKTPNVTSCFPFSCGVAACNATCKANADCAAKQICINGSCGLEPKGGPCTASAQCSSGLVCSAQNVCCNAVCDGPCVSCTLSATAGTCSPIAANTSCTVSDLCHVSAGTCQGGVCTSALKTCPPAELCHAAGTCDPSSGTCSTGALKTCPPADLCHAAGTCDPNSGMCSTGALKTCPPADLCHAAGTCDASTGACSTGAPKTCPGATQCQGASACDPSSGNCSTPMNLDDGTPCDDGVGCIGDTCSDGVCQPGNMCAHPKAICILNVCI